LGEKKKKRERSREREEEEEREKERRCKGCVKEAAGVSPKIVNQVFV